MPETTIEFPCDTNDILYLGKKALPLSEIDEYDAEIPMFLEGRVVSLKKTGNRKYIKIAVKANWIRDCYDCDENGIRDRYRAGLGICEKSFTFSCNVIGKTVFYSLEEAKKAAEKDKWLAL